MLKKITVIIFLSCSLFGQMQPERVEDTFNNITKGFLNSYKWYDVFFVAAYQDPQFINESNLGDKLVFPPLNIERNIFNDITYRKNISLGSMDKDLIPSTIFYTRLIGTTLLNLYTNTNVTPESYHKLFMFHKTLLYNDVVAIITKGLVKRTRPDGSNNRSFFSSHSSTTFAAATYLYMELHDAYDNWSLTKNDPIWRITMETLSSGILFGWAGYVAYSRVYDKAHYISDVIVGAAVGTALAYLLYEDHFNEDWGIFNNLSVLKFDDKAAISLTIKLN